MGFKMERMAKHKNKAYAHFPRAVLHHFIMPINIQICSDLQNYEKANGKDFPFCSHGEKTMHIQFSF